MGKLIVLTGKSGSGKSSIESVLIRDYGLKKIISCTTREKRAKEVDGDHYYFISESQYDTLDRDGKFFEKATYAGGDTTGKPIKYGILNAEIDDKLKKNNCVTVVEPSGYHELVSKIGSENIISLYIDCDDTERIIKSISRYGDRSNEYLYEICRRFVDDATRFDGMSDIVDFTIRNDYKPDTIKHLASFIYSKVL